MRVICKCCGSIIEEHDAINMSVNDYSTFLQDKGMVVVNMHYENSSEYTQICEKCYKKPNAPWEENLVWWRLWKE